MKYLPLQLSGREISGLINNVKNLPFLKLIKMLLYDPVVVWCPCVIYEHLAILRHRNVNTVEAEMQLAVWCCREAGRRLELLHWVRQLLRSEMQGRKYKSLEEMEKKKKKGKILVSFVSLGQGKHLTVYRVNIWARSWASHRSTPHPALQGPIGKLGFWFSVSRIGLQPLNKTLSFSGERQMIKNSPVKAGPKQMSSKQICNSFSICWFPVRGCCETEQRCCVSGEPGCTSQGADLKQGTCIVHPWTWHFCWINVW